MRNLIGLLRVRELGGWGEGWGWGWGWGTPQFVEYAETVENCREYRTEIIHRIVFYNRKNLRNVNQQNAHVLSYCFDSIHRVFYTFRISCVRHQEDHLYMEFCTVCLSWPYVSSVAGGRILHLLDC